MAPRLKTAIWVSAYLRARAAEGVNGAVVRKGDETAGSVLVRVNLLDGRSRVFAAAYGVDGERLWASVLKDDPASDAEAEAYIARAVARDGDLWVVEVEDRAGEAKLEGF
ncbi:MAG: DUF1491 family protein [Alphaproteobacteria bacterium]